MTLYRHHSNWKKAASVVVVAVMLSLLASAPSWADTTEIITYTYDNAYQLITAEYSGGAREDYLYDPSGNRLVFTATASVGAVNNSPNTPSSPLPVNQAINISNANLGWQGGDPDGADDQMTCYFNHLASGEDRFVPCSPQAVIRGGRLA